MDIHFENPAIVRYRTDISYSWLDLLGEWLCFWYCCGSGCAVHIAMGVAVLFILVWEWLCCTYAVGVAVLYILVWKRLCCSYWCGSGCAVHIGVGVAVLYILVWEWLCCTYSPIFHNNAKRTIQRIRTNWTAIALLRH
jgi:hypothetical protein